MKLNLKFSLLILFAVVIVALGGLYLFKPAWLIKPAGVSCGGWDILGDVVCECSGQLEKSTCPPKADCDAGTDVCYGACGECKCYQGPASDGLELPCEGREKHFK